MNDTEREAIILNSAWEMIDGMVNWGMFVKTELTRPTNLVFHTHQHSLLLTILLGDFLSEIRSFKGDPVPLGLRTAPSAARPSDLTFIFHLRQVCANPKLGTRTTDLSTAIEAFADWLEEDTFTEGVNLSDINVVTDMIVPRYRYLKMCGDIAKHNLARLETNVRHLRKLLEKSGHSVSEQEAYMAISNFFQWFHGSIFLYHSSWIAEFLNNIRWAIYDYLEAEFQRSWHLTKDATPDFPMYKYRIPTDVTEPVAHGMYWDVMNRARAKPWMQRFSVPDSFKQRH